MFYSMVITWAVIDKLEISLKSEIFQVPDDNCVLNFETSVTRPDLFVMESIQIVEYFDFRSCWALQLLNLIAYQ